METLIVLFTMYLLFLDCYFQSFRVQTHIKPKGRQFHFFFCRPVPPVCCSVSSNCSFNLYSLLNWELQFLQFQSTLKHKSPRFLSRVWKSFIIENFSLHCLVKYIFYGCISVFFNSTIYQECDFGSLGNWPVWWYWTVCGDGKPGNDAGLILKFMLWIGPHICRLQYSYL